MRAAGTLESFFKVIPKTTTLAEMMEHAVFYPLHCLASKIKRIYNESLINAPIKDIFKRRIGFGAFEWLVAPILAIAILTLNFGCAKKAELDTLVSQSSEATSIEFNPSQAKYNAFLIENGTESFVGELKTKNNELLVPQALINGLFGVRTSNFEPQPLNLIVKGYLLNAATKSGDFYFETPIVGPKAEVNSMTTALTVFLRTAVSPLPKISRSNWERILKTVEFNCSTCIIHPFSYVLERIKSDKNLVNSILSLIQSESKGTTYTVFSIHLDLLPKYLVAWSQPMLEGVSAPSSSVVEGDELPFTITFVNAADSTSRQSPDHWSTMKETAPASGVFETTATSSSQFDYKVLFENGWSQRKSVLVRVSAAVAANSPGPTLFTFPFNLGFTDRQPIFSDIKSITFKQNHYNEYDLAALNVARDPDGTQLIYQCVSCPPGVIISGATLAWTPTSDVNLPGIFEAKIKAIDQDRSSAIGAIQLIVTEDHAPSILSVAVDGSALTSTPITLDEGSTYHFAITAIDSDPEDQLAFKSDLFFANGVLSSGQTDRGESENTGFSNLTTSKVGLITTFEFDLKVSYFQVVDLSDVIVNSVFAVNYDFMAVDANGHRLFSPYPEVIQLVYPLKFINKDDAPVFYADVLDTNYAGPLIANNFNAATNYNDGTPIKQSEAMQIVLNIATLPAFAAPLATINLDVHSFNRTLGAGESTSKDCGAIDTLSVSNGKLNWTTIPTSSPTLGTCDVILMATSSTGLKTIAQAPIRIKITRNNVAPTVAAAFNNLFTGVEGPGDIANSNTWSVASAFTDSNNDTLTYTVTCKASSPQPATGPAVVILPCPSGAASQPSVSGGSIAWAPDYNQGSGDVSAVYAFEVIATDPDGLSATTNVYIHIADSPAPPNVTLSTTSITVAENKKASFLVTVEPYRADGSNVDAIDQYNYKLTQSCSPSGGTSISSRIKPPADTTGNTSTAIKNFEYFADFETEHDYDSGTSKDGFKTYSCHFQVTNTDLNIIYPNSFNIDVTVTNTNRDVSVILVGANAGTSPMKTVYDFIFPTAPLTSPNTKFTMYIKVSDADGINDTYNLTITPTIPKATITELSKGLYKYEIDFKSYFPNCLVPGTGSLPKILSIVGKDLAGTSAKISVTLNVKSVTAKTGSCY
jgi:hypothetical protein